MLELVMLELVKLELVKLETVVFVANGQTYIAVILTNTRAHDLRLVKFAAL